MLKRNIVALLVYSSVQAAVLDKEGQHSSDSRVHHARPLAGVERVEGDYEYDHEAFLGGGDTLNEFNELSPAESKRRLLIILDRIDTDQDKYISEEELRMWIEKVQTTEARRDTDELWEQKVPAGDTSISWLQYRNSTYGFVDDPTVNFPGGFNFTSMIQRDDRRFNKADRNADGVLDRDEFQNFVHPEESWFMRDVTVMETLEEMDKDNDGKIGMHEFINDLWKGEEGELEPDWLASERDQFLTHRDKDGDGFLNFKEVQDWIMPDDFDLPLVEAHHLITTVDSDDDNLLTKDEILERYDVFVGSTATRYGILLNRHDEF